MWKLLKEKGQTSLEYVMLMMVGVSLGWAFKKKMEDYLLKSPNSVISQALNGYKKQFEADTSGRYRWFPLKR